ncbi:MAG: 3-hydroxybutyryl-CoA dehydrogenase [Thermoanaerobaculia bacterium]|nr:3-hydroxybutyryl-CoA dehydrogenase [Thermoanaerobaculia bacterium]
MRFEKVGVVGAGVMGVGVAQNLAQTGHQVVLVDVGEEQLGKARAQIRQDLRMYNLLSKQGGIENPKVLAEGSQAALARIQLTTDLGALADAQFVIENVVEKWPVKEEVYRQIDPICPAETIFAANTSAVSITRIGSLTQRPRQVLGMHFMNPVPMKPVVEVIRGFHTSEETIAGAQELLAEMGKEGIVVNDMPGFVSNRVLMLTINEAIYLVQDQVASAEDVDRIFETCFGHKMGPLATGDLIGLDTILYSLDVLYESYNDDKFRPCPLLKKMVYAGLWGRKSGRGFYNYETVA